MTRPEAIAALLSRLSPPQAEELCKVLESPELCSPATVAYWERKIAAWMED